jgi:acetyl-CoA carboxylase carboxyltransferase component
MHCISVSGSTDLLANSEEEAITLVRKLSILPSYQLFRKPPKNETISPKEFEKSLSLIIKMPYLI